MGKSELPQPICSLLTYLAAKEAEREKQRAEMGGGEVFFMRRSADLSARDGEVGH